MHPLPEVCHFWRHILTALVHVLPAKIPEASFFYAFLSERSWTKLQHLLHVERDPRFQHMQHGGRCIGLGFHFLLLSTFFPCLFLGSLFLFSIKVCQILRIVHSFRS